MNDTHTSAANQTPAGNDPSVASPTGKVPPKRMLMIDDDPEERDIFAHVLKDIKPETLFHGASNGQKAIEQLGSQADPLPDLIFLDLNMPVMDGLTFLRTIRQEPRFKHIPVLVHSTSSSSSVKSQALQLGVLGYIVKYEEYEKMRKMLGLVARKLSVDQVGAIYQALREHALID